MNPIKIAWKNLWRNRKRTLITVASVFFAVIFSTLMTSMQEGVYSKLINNMVKLYTGYAQIHHPDYWENKSINNTYEPTDSLYNILSSNEHIKQIIPRLESFSLIAHGNKTKGGAVIGVDPVKENEMTNLSNWVKEGKYLQPGDSGVLLTSNVAKNLKVEPGDTLIFLSQGYHGASAAGLYPVRGIVKFNSPDLNNLGVYMDITMAQHFFSAPNMVSSLSLMMEDYHEVNDATSSLSEALGDKYSVMSWDEMNAELVQMIQSDRNGGIIFKVILYLIIGFSILGTVIMMVAERKRELGVMVAVGMHKYKLNIILFIETVFMGLLGVLSGFLVSVPIIYSFVQNPIPLSGEMAEMYIQYGFEPYMFFSMYPSIFIKQTIVVFLLSLLVAIYPLFKVKNLKIMNALRA